MLRQVRAVRHLRDAPTAYEGCTDMVRVHVGLSAVHEGLRVHEGLSTVCVECMRASVQCIRASVECISASALCVESARGPLHQVHEGLNM